MFTELHTSFVNFKWLNWALRGYIEKTGISIMSAGIVFCYPTFTTWLTPLAKPSCSSPIGFRRVPVEDCTGLKNIGGLHFYLAHGNLFNRAHLVTLLQ